LQHTLHAVEDTHDVFTMLCMSILALSFAALNMLYQSMLQKGHVIATTCLFD